MDQGVLKRIEISGLPEAVMLRSGAIRFRHYQISVHALDRFAERLDRPVEDILPMLNDAVLAVHGRAKAPGIRRVIRVAEQRGGYVLYNRPAFFVVVPDPKVGLHVVSTVMTPRYMTSPGPKAKQENSSCQD